MTVIGGGRVEVCQLQVEEDFEAVMYCEEATRMQIFRRCVTAKFVHMRQVRK